MSAYFSKIIIIITLLSGSITVNAQKFLIPDDAIVQYAGSIGYISIGAGYEIFGNKRGNIDLNYGYVPKSKGGELHMFTAKFAYKPFVIKIKDWAVIYPFNPGVFVTYTVDDALSFNFPTDVYPKGYYYWSEAVRPHLYFSNEFRLTKSSMLDKTGLKALSIYSEFNTNDYYLVNFFQNTSTIPITDIFKLGIGIRAKF
ncbi:MAG: hypothetical protein EOO92_01220 [Pedobacter sp.]|nr:MAG: hypothetical protein EOO92_01220 [Pedobacter sp.]